MTFIRDWVKKLVSLYSWPPPFAYSCNLPI